MRKQKDAKIIIQIQQENDSSKFEILIENHLYPVFIFLFANFVHNSEFNMHMLIA